MYTVIQVSDKITAQSNLLKDSQVHRRRIMPPIALRGTGVAIYAASIHIPAYVSTICCVLEPV